MALNILYGVHTMFVGMYGVTHSVWRTHYACKYVCQYTLYVWPTHYVWRYTLYVRHTYIQRMYVWRTHYVGHYGS